MEYMDEEAIKEYVKNMSKDSPGFAKLSYSQSMEMLNITKDGVYTLASVMNFALYPQGFFPQLCITAIVVSGMEIGETGDEYARFIDNKRINGTIPQMAEEALNFCRRNMKVRTIINKETGGRSDLPEYPMEALREAIINALIHRDYSIHTEGTPVQIDFFSDRVEIHSPGTLYGRMTIDELGKAKPDLRNPFIATMSERLTTAEHRYSGIPTMRRYMKEYGLPEPRFENRRNEFVVTFFNKSETKREEDEMENNTNLLDFCRQPRSRQEIADFLGIKTVVYAIQTFVYPLVEEGKLAMTMPTKPRSKNQKYFTI